MDMLTVLPFLFIILFLLIPVVLFYGKRAIVRGDWSKHRNFMVLGLGLWATVMGMMVVYLLGNGFDFLFSDHNILPLIFFAIALLTSVALALTLFKVIKHQYLPHKMLARKTIKVWGATSLLGALLFGYISLVTMIL